MNSLVPSLALLSSFLAIILGAFLVLVPSATRLANILLALFLVATAVDVSGWFMGQWWARHGYLDQYKVVLALVQMPCFTGFIWFNCFQRQALRFYDGLHFLPAAAAVCFIAADADFPFLRIIFETQYAVYIGIAIYALWRVRTEMKNHFIGHSANWRWLAMLVATSLFAHSIFVFRTVFAADLSPGLLGALETSAAILILIIIVSIAFQALLNPQVFRGLDRIMASAIKELRQPGSDEAERIGTYLEDHRPYLDPDLSLSRLARQIGMTAKDLSAAINQRYGVHFFDFVNRYRVEYAKTLLTETDQSVTEIFLASGFNAKSSFNTAFRKHCGVTPSVYPVLWRNCTKTLEMSRPSSI